MIQAVQDQQITLTSNSASLPFADTDLRTNSANCFNGWLNHNEGSAQFNIVAGGIYEITFNANVTSATAGNVALGIYANGSLLQGSEVDVPVTVGIFNNVANNKKIRVCNRGNATITIQSIPSIVYNETSTATQIPIVKNANISIKRLNG
jgi:hypothetical protein